MTQIAEQPSSQLIRQNGPSTPAKRQSALSSMASRMAIEPARLMEVLKNTVIKATDRYTPTDEEIAAFIVVANEFDLNPFLREIHAFADPRKGIIPIVGIDGWAKIVNREPRFDGCDFETVHEDGDTGMVCTMHVKDRSHPIKVTEWLKECQRPTDPWRGMPKRMLRHKSYMQAARIAFSISGIYDEDEANDIVASHQVTTQSDDPQVTRTQKVLDKVKAKTETTNIQTSEVQQTPAAATETPAPTESKQDAPAGSEAKEPPQDFPAQCWQLAEDLKYDPDQFKVSLATALRLADKDKRTKELTAPARAKVLKEIMARSGVFAPPAAAAD